MLDSGTKGKFLLDYAVTNYQFTWMANPPITLDNPELDAAIYM